MTRAYIKINDLIDEISMGPFGSDIKVEYFVDAGVPVLNGSNISGVKLKDGSDNYVTEERARGYRKALAERGDIVITHRGTLGQIAYVPENSEFKKYVISQSQFRVKLKTELVNPIFFTYYFHTNEGQKRLLSFKSHVGVPALAQATTNFRRLDFPVYPKKEQDLIAKTLETLDKKIELNNRINTELEAMAKALYDYWFVQFDFPNAKGKPYKTSSGKMEYNSILKREIPEGWEAANILSVSYLLGGGTPTKAKPEYWNGTIPFFTPTDSNSSIYSLNTEDCITAEGLKNSSTKLFEKNTVFITARGSVGRLAINSVPMAMNQSCYALKAKEGVSYTFLFFLTKELIHHLKIKATGSVFNSIVSTDIEYTNLALPIKQDLINQFSIKVEPIFEKIELLTRENTQLSSLRDWLLPMLMNGQVTIK